jgi:hypothetical protein
VFLRSELQRMEAQGGSVSDRNGYLGAWVAQKALLGEFPVAWCTMLSSYNPNSGWEMNECIDNQPLLQCPASRVHRMTFPEALYKLLVKQGYIPAEADANVAADPKASQPSSGGTKPVADAKLGCTAFASAQVCE